MLPLAWRAVAGGRTVGGSSGNGMDRWRNGSAKRPPDRCAGSGGCPASHNWGNERRGRVAHL